MRNPVNRAAAVTIFLLALMMLLGTGWASGTEADPESVPTVCIDNVHGNLNERIEKTEPTCENPGKEEMVVFCIDCGTEIAREVIRQWDATGHSWGEWTVTGQVTCEADGSETRRCLHDADHAETRTIPATGHSWGEWTVSRPAACEADGSETRRCLHDADHAETRTIPATGHSWGEWTVSRPAACEADGSETRRCLHDADHAETRTIEAPGHSWGEWTVTGQATCEAAGSEARYCTHDANHVETRTTEALGHSWGEWTVTGQVTCEADGSEARRCTHDADHVETRTIPATGHSWSEWTVTGQATCEAAGSEARHCLHDPNHVETQAIAATGHSWGEWTVIRPAACEAAGSETRHCLHDTDHVETRTIEATGHSWGDWAVTVQVTCEAAGSETRHCLHDTDHAETRTIEATGHSWGDWTGTKPAACETDGTEARHCIHDADHAETRTIPATGHSWGEWAVIRPASCEADGSEARHCLHDADHTETRTIHATGHSWLAWRTVLGPTCDRAGKEMRTCANDRTHSYTRDIEPLGHQYRLIRSRPATCTAAGSDRYLCTRNLRHYRIDTHPALGHQWGDWETVKPATVKEEGEEQRVCARDGRHMETRVIEKIPGLRLTSKTSVDLAGLMTWDREINRDQPVIRVNGKSMAELSEEEKNAIRNNREVMVFLLDLISDTGKANVPDTLQLSVPAEQDAVSDSSGPDQEPSFAGLVIQVDRTRLDSLIKEASRRQEGRDVEILYKQAEDEKKKQEEEVRKVVEQVQSNQNDSAYTPSSGDIEIRLVFRPEEEKIKFEETKKNDEIQVAKFNESKDEKEKKKCLTPDTLITLADGSQKRVDELAASDRVLVWDFDLGALSEAPLTFLHSVSEEAPVLRAGFSDGTSVGIIGEHVLFDLTDRQFAVISSVSQKEALVGHSFAKLSDGQITGVILTELYEDGIADSYYSPVSEAHFNCFANGMLNISGFMQGFFNVFDLENDALKYDAEKKTAELKAVGELPYEIFDDLFPRELYERNKVGWLSVSITKGLVNPEDLYDLFEFCIPFFVEN